MLEAQARLGLLRGIGTTGDGGISRTDRRTSQALVSEPLARTGKVALVRCGEETRYGSIEAVYRQQATPGLCAVHPDQPYTRVEKVFLFRKDEGDLRDRLDRWFAARPPD